MLEPNNPSTLNSTLSSSNTQQTNLSNQSIHPQSFAYKQTTPNGDISITSSGLLASSIVSPQTPTLNSAINFNVTSISNGTQNLMANQPLLPPISLHAFQNVCVPSLPTNNTVYLTQQSTQPNTGLNLLSQSNISLPLHPTQLALPTHAQSSVSNVHPSVPSSSNVVGGSSILQKFNSLSRSPVSIPGVPTGITGGLNSGMPSGLSSGLVNGGMNSNLNINNMNTSNNLNSTIGSLNPGMTLSSGVTPSIGLLSSSGLSSNNLNDLISTMQPPSSILHNVNSNSNLNNLLNTAAGSTNNLSSLLQSGEQLRLGLPRNLSLSSLTPISTPNQSQWNQKWSQPLFQNPSSSVGSVGVVVGSSVGSGLNLTHNTLTPASPHISMGNSEHMQAQLHTHTHGHAPSSIMHRVSSLSTLTPASAPTFNQPISHIPKTRSSASLFSAIQMSNSQLHLDAEDDGVLPSSNIYASSNNINLNIDYPSYLTNVSHNGASVHYPFNTHTHTLPQSFSANALMQSAYSSSSYVSHSLASNNNNTTTPNGESFVVQPPRKRGRPFKKVFSKSPGRPRLRVVDPDTVSVTFVIAGMNASDIPDDELMYQDDFENNMIDCDDDINDVIVDIEILPEFASGSAYKRKKTNAPESLVIETRDPIDPLAPLASRRSRRDRKANDSDDFY